MARFSLGYYTGMLFKKIVNELKQWLQYNDEFKK